jgi:hypothetical protein
VYRAAGGDRQWMHVRISSCGQYLRPIQWQTGRRIIHSDRERVRRASDLQDAVAWRGADRETEGHKSRSIPVREPFTQDARWSQFSDIVLHALPHTRVLIISFPPAAVCGCGCSGGVAGTGVASQVSTTTALPRRRFRPNHFSAGCRPIRASVRALCAGDLSDVQH